jgi:PIN domain nuclease of toxin-antitoxin system
MSSHAVVVTDPSLITDAIDVTVLPSWIRRRDGQPHKDPNDRFIVAIARKRNAVLLTCDEEIIHYGNQGHVNVYDVRP